MIPPMKPKPYPASRRAIQVWTTLLAGAVAGAALVYLSAADPGPAMGPPLEAPLDPASPLDPSEQAPAPPPKDAAQPSQDVPGDEDWMDAHLRGAAQVWADAAAQAQGSPSPELRALAGAMADLGKKAPPPAAELPRLPVVVPFLAEEIALWRQLPAEHPDFGVLDRHMAPLLPKEITGGASRPDATEPIR